MIIHKDWPPSKIVRRILFPIDGSESSKAVMQWGIRFLDHAEASIHFLIAVKSMDKDYSPLVTVHILEEARNCFEESKFHVEKADFVINPNISSAICRFADDQNIDYIVMGSHGKTFGRLMIGSISRAVMEKARQPVVIIKNPHFPLIEADEPIRLARTHVRNVLVPIDREDTAEKLISLMAGLLDKQSAVIHLLHAVFYDPHNASHIHSQFESGKKIIEKNREGFEAAGYWVAAAECRSGDPGDVILNYAHERGIDQITVLSRHLSNIEKFLFGSVSTALVKQDKFKVLIFSYGKK
jgi:nucleotide-binding universal stress UspA family protein